jgi:hypothetical protein
MTVDWDATKYIGLTIEWDYKNRKAHIHMPGYLKKAFTRFKHQKPDKIQNSPHPHVITHYGAKTQYAKEEDVSPPLSTDDTKFVQAVAGTLLCYARAVDATILPALSLIATEQAKPTQRTMETIKQLLDYCHVIGRRSRTRCIIFKCKRSRLSLPDINQNGTPSIANTDPNGQHDSRGRDK